jgi:CHAT domain
MAAGDTDLQCTFTFVSNERIMYEDTYGRSAAAEVDRGGLSWRTIAVLASWVRDHDDYVGRVELEVLGSHLYDLLFADAIGAEFAESYRAFERRQGRRGRVRLDLCFHPEAEELAGLPWEFLYRPGRPGGFFLAGEDIGLVLSRLVPRDLQGEVAAARRPLKVLVVSCHHVPEARSYVEQIKSTISGLTMPGDIELTPLDDPTFDELCDAVQDGQPDVLHVIAHGKPAGLMMKRAVDPDEVRAHAAWQRAGEPVPAVNDGVLIRARTVKSTFDIHQPHLVLLHACDGDAPGPTSADDAPALAVLFSTAREIAYAGVPAVVAMQYRISVEHALTFVKEFYGALMSGATVSDATKQGRRKLAKDPEEAAVREDWGTRRFGAPVVYVQQDVPLVTGQQLVPAHREPPLGAARPGASSGRGVQRLRRCASCGTGNNPANDYCRACRVSLGTCVCGHVYDDPRADGYCGKCQVSLWLDDGSGRDQLVSRSPQDPGSVADKYRRPAGV